MADSAGHMFHLGWSLSDFRAVLPLHHLSLGVMTELYGLDFLGGVLGFELKAYTLSHSTSPFFVQYL
jgi:hypothetical protein